MSVCPHCNDTGRRLAGGPTSGMACAHCTAGAALVGAALAGLPAPCGSVAGMVEAHRAAHPLPTTLSEAVAAAVPLLPVDTGNALLAAFHESREQTAKLGDLWAGANDAALAAGELAKQWEQRAGVLEAERALAVEARQAEEALHAATMQQRDRLKAALREERLVHLTTALNERDTARAERDAALRHLSPKPDDDDTNGARLVKGDE